MAALIRRLAGRGGRPWRGRVELAEGRTVGSSTARGLGRIIVPRGWREAAGHKTARSRAQALQAEARVSMRRIMKTLLVAGLIVGTGAAGEESVIVDRPQAQTANPYYVGNRPPLLPSPFLKLPIGAIEPRGWLRKQLELEAAGFSGHLTEISEFLKKENNAWLSPSGTGEHGWEEVPYWLKGFGDLGYVLRDQRIIQEARIWLEAVLASQREDGYFGPRANLTHRDTNGKPDLWPNMIMLNALQSYYEYSGDERVVKLMTNYFRWELSIPEEDFLVPFWQQQRAADNLASVYWLYNRTGEPWLLDLGQKIHRRTANWTDRVANWHGVNISQAFRGPAVYYQQSHDRKHLDAAWQRYQDVMSVYGQVPGGGYGADENCRPGYTGPRQGTETCTWAELMLSFEMLLKISGDAKWADLCEEVAFNSLPTSMTVDLKALHYLTAPNLVLCDGKNHAPGIQNGGEMLSYNPHAYRCCQHNVAHAWPYYAEHLWLATPGGGLAAVMYAPCEVKAKVGDGIEVTIVEDTKYPFEEKVELTLSIPKPVHFPLQLRLPDWCRPSLQVAVNGQALEVQSIRPGFAVLERQWADGDKVRITLPMSIRLRKWEKNHHSVSVDRGPLTYSLKIGEKYVRYGGTDAWPAFEVHPTTPWNYGFVLDEENPAPSFQVVEKAWPASGQPFEAESVPVELRAEAKKIPAWKVDRFGLVGPLQPSPAQSNEPVETVTLIPMGAARLRIAAFPIIGSGSGAHDWLPPPEPKPSIPASASHCGSGDTVAALSDGLEPKNSNDHEIPRFTWWDHRGTTEWVQYDFEKPRKLARVEVYWFDDTGMGQCRVPQSWRLLYRVGEEWKPVTGASEYGTQRDRFNVVTYDPVETTGLRIEVKLQKDFSAGILEWKIP
jgi:hypothetical protein